MTTIKTANEAFNRLRDNVTREREIKPKFTRVMVTYLPLGLSVVWTYPIHTAPQKIEELNASPLHEAQIINTF